MRAWAADLDRRRASMAAFGSKARAADLLGVSRKTLDRKCAEWGV